MKKILVLLLIPCLLLLMGCNVEEKVKVENSDPQKLFIKAQAVLKDKIPTAKFEIDVNNRIIKANADGNIDYPIFVELRFVKDKDGTEVTIIAPDDDKQKLDNLYHLLKTEVEKQQQDMTLEKKPSSPPSRPRHQRRGHPVRTRRDRRLDLNRDGWVGPRELRLGN